MSSKGLECSLKNICTALNDFSDIEQLMVHLGMDLRRVQMIQRNQPQNPLMYCMDEWIKRTPDANWERIATALENCHYYSQATKIRKEWMKEEEHNEGSRVSSKPHSHGNSSIATWEASNIRSVATPEATNSMIKVKQTGSKKHLPASLSLADTHTSIMQQSTTNPVLHTQNDKDMIVLREKFNEASSKIETFHWNVKEEIRREKLVLSDAESLLRQEFVKDLDELQERVENLSAESIEYEKKLTEALNMLRKGDSSALHILESFTYENMEKECFKLDSKLTKLKRKIPLSSGRLPNEEKLVEENLKDMLKMTFTNEGTEIDDEELYSQIK